MNMVAIIGNVAAEPELRHTPTGQQVANLRVAVNRGRDKPADFFDVVAWEKQADVVAQYVRKGHRIGIEGRLQTSSWSTEDGSKRSRVEIVAYRVDLLTSKDVPGLAIARPSQDQPSLSSPEGEPWG